MKLFGKHVEPACEYCEHGKKTANGQLVLCIKSGVVSPFYSCRHFAYSPLLRVPKKAAPLPKFEKKDFSY